MSNIPCTDKPMKLSPAVKDALTKACKKLANRRWGDPKGDTFLLANLDMFCEVFGGVIQTEMRGMETDGRAECSFVSYLSLSFGNS